jgi:hypothetical protein
MWETRSGRLYYYRRERVSGRQVRRYVGAGPLAEMAAQADELRRQQRRLARELQQARREQARRADEDALRFSRLVELLQLAALRPLGYRHHRGQWRKRRSHEDTMPKTPTTTVDKLTPEQVAKLNEVLERAQRGDQAVLPELERALEEHPSIWQQAGDLGQRVLDGWLRLLAGVDLLFQEATKRKLAQLRDDLLGGGTSPLERLVAERVLVTYLQACHADAEVAAARGVQGAPHAVLLRRQESAQRSHLQAAQKLAQVRRLLRPALSPIEIATRGMRESAVPGTSRRAGRAFELVSD